MKQGIFLLLTLLVLAHPLHAQVKESTTAPSHTALFDPSRNAAEDVRLAVAEADSSGKRILLDVGGNWCKWCKMLDAFFGTNPKVAAFLHDNFVVVKVNFSKENDNKELLSKYPKVPGYPHFFILESDGSLLHSQDTGVLEQGKGYDADKIMAFLKQWTKKKDMQ